MKSKRKSH